MEIEIKKAFLIGVEVGYQQCKNGKSLEEAKLESERLWNLASIIWFGIKCIMGLSR